MTKHPEKKGFLARTPRLFTRRDRDVYADIPFQEAEQTGDETVPALECPEDWSAEAAAILAEHAACRSIPAHMRAIEENTVPSWLWRHEGQGTARAEETGVGAIFDRVAGSAAYIGWKQNLFSDESEAQIFFDEMRALLIRRLIAFEPRTLADMGLDWAYGINELPDAQPMRESVSRGIDIPNTMIDAFVSGSADKAMRARRQKLRPDKGTQSVILRLSDVVADWGTTSEPGAKVVLDLMGFRHNDGWINIESLRQAVRLTVIMLDLHGAQTGSRLDIGFVNLAPLLMALALPYDSDHGRSVAAAVSAIITAEAYATSAELAGLRGPGADFIANRETALRVLRNHRRAAYGDRNDYEKISVIPVPLMLEHAPDLALVAVAQRRWEDAVQFARHYGLRHTQVTGLGASPVLTVYTESVAQGIAPVPSLTLPRSAGPDLFRQEIIPPVAEALARLGYDRLATGAIIGHIAGAGTLEKAPTVNHVALRGHGFDEAAIGRVEDYLRYVTDIRLAFTPWIIGEEFCRKTLKIPAIKIQNPRFDLLHHLGFSDADIAAANAFCYGLGSARGAKDLRQQHAPVFARADEISPEARIRMAAAAQSFISGDAGLSVTMPAESTAEQSESLLLLAWRQGVKSVSMGYDAAARESGEKRLAKKPGKETSTAAFLHTRQPGPLPARRLRPKAGSNIVSLSRGRGKASPASRGKRH